MKKINFILFFFLLMGCISCTSDAKKNEERNAIVDSTLINFQKIYFKNQLDAVIAQNHFNGCVSVFRNQEKLYEKENGLKDFKLKTKLDSNTVFAIGSLSKQFTAVLILLQEEKGKLKTSDKASIYLPEFKTKELENITIHELLNHTSGLNDFSENLLFKSGTDFNYSNKGYRNLGRIIEKVSGKSFHENLKELFIKAGMKRSFPADHFSGNNFAGAFVGGKTQPQNVEGMPERLADKEIGIPAGGILSTISDLHSWNQALFGGEILNPESLKKLTEKSANRDHPIFGKVGYCYGIMCNLGKPKAYFHTGYVKGSPSLNIYYPETKTSVIILSNIADESKGIDQIFIPHSEIKNTTDAIENAVIELQKQIMKK